MEEAKESIIVATVRTFCKSFAAVIGVLIALILVTVALLLFSTPDLYPPKSTLTIEPDAQGQRDLLSSTTPVILKLNITGVVGQGDLTAEKVQNSLLDSREGILSNNRVKAILLYINTPGGTVDDASGIYHALLDYKKKYQVPVYAFVEGLCASGGMYIAASADKIFATETSVIGSIGVILGPTFNFYGLMEKHGVSSLAITQGKDKDALNPFRPWQPGEEAPLKAITADLYEQFVDIVTHARPRLNKEKLINEYGAHVFIAKRAEEYGYIDESQAHYASTLVQLLQAAQLSEEQPYQVLTIGPSHPLLSELTEGHLSLLKGKITHEFQLNSSMNSELSGKFLYLYQPSGI